MTSILDMFARSPIRPIQSHMQSATECVLQLEPFMTAVLAADWSGAETALKAIVSLERRADDLKKDLRSNLPKGLFMVVPRGDILSLLTVQDKMANEAKDVAGLIWGRRLQPPSGFHPCWFLPELAEIFAELFAPKALFR